MKLDRFTEAYIECALWSSTDDDGEPLDNDYGFEDLDEACLKQMVEDCRAFQEGNDQWIKSEHCRVVDCEAQAGHDFWLTRNGHGAGFWDGDWERDADKAMTACSKAYGSVDLYVGDDGKIYCL